MTLHPIISAYGVEIGSASLKAPELLGEEGLREQNQIRLGKRKGEGSLGRQAAMFMMKGILVAIIRNLDFSLCTYQTIEEF